MEVLKRENDYPFVYLELKQRTFEANRLARIGRIDEALQVAIKAAELDSTRPAVNRLLALLYKKREESSENVSATVRHHIELAYQRFHDDLVEEALKEVGVALALNPYNEEGLKLRSKVEKRMQQLQKLESLEDTEEIANAADHLIHEANRLARSGKFSEALLAEQKAIEIAPESKKALKLAALLQKKVRN